MTRVVRSFSSGPTVLRWFGACLCLWGINALLNAPAGDARDKVNVLVLSSFSKDLPAQRALEDGFDAATHYRQGANNVYFEYMDGPNIAPRDAGAHLAEYLQSKYRSVPLDHLIGWAPGAIGFLRAHPELFPEAGRIHLERTATAEARGHPEGGRTRRIEVVSDYRATLKEILRIEAPRTIYVIGSTEDAGARSRVKNFELALAGVAPGMRTEYLLDRPLDEVAATLRDLPRKGTAAFYLLLFSDGKGTRMTPYAAVRRLAAISSVPLYSHWASLMGSGIVGGVLFSQEAVGEALGNALLSDGKGGWPSTLPCLRLVYDWRALERWGIPTDVVPEGATVLNRPTNLLHQYRYHLLAVAGAFTVLTLFTLFLARTVRARNRALAALDQERANLSTKVRERTRELVASNTTLLNEVEARKRSEAEKEDAIHDLRNALEEIKTLRGILPICIHCKKIRDDAGLWSRIEEYISSHSEAEFSHGICPECLRKIYPDYAENILGKKPQ